MYFKNTAEETGDLMQSETKYVEILKAVEFGTEESIEIPKERYAFPKKRRQT